MNKRRISVLYKIMITVCLAFGIGVNLANTQNIPAMLSYFTIQSNIVCLVSFAIFIVLELTKKDYKNSDKYYIVKGAITISILVTGIVYNVALSPIDFKMDIRATADIETITVHIIAPIIVFLDYLIFDQKGKFKILYSIFWLLIPLSYVIYVYIYAAHGGTFFGIGGSRKFAYFFLDYEKIGYIGVIKWIAIIGIFIIGLSNLLMMLDWKMAKKELG